MQKNEPDDLELIQQTLAGNHSKFSKLVSRYSSYVYFWISGIVPYTEDVEDIVQMAFIKAFTSLPSLQDSNRFSGWLKRIAQNEARVWYRKRIKQMRIDNFPEDRITGCDQRTSSQVSNWPLRMLVREALKGLSDPHQEVVVQHHLKGYSYRETAHLLGINENTVKSRLQKARRKLKEEVNNVNTIKETKNTYKLNKRDLSLLRWASDIARFEKKYQQMQGICLDVGGQIVATDGRRLIIATSKNLEDLVAPVIFAKPESAKVFGGERAILEVENDGVIFQVEGKERLSFPLLTEPYLKYEAIIPKQEPLCTAESSSDELREANGLIAEHLATRHPVDEPEQWKYVPMIEIQISKPKKTFTLLTNRDLGYCLRNMQKSKGESGGKSQAAIPSRGVHWTYSITPQAEIDILGDKDLLRIGVSFQYWEDGIRGMSDLNAGNIKLEFFGSDQPVVFTSTIDNLTYLLAPMMIEA